MAQKKGEGIETIVIPDDEVRILSASQLEGNSLKLPKYDSKERKKELRDRNYHGAIDQMVGTWSEDCKIAYIKRATRKTPTKKVQDDVFALKEAVLRVAYKALRIKCEEDSIEVTDEIFLINNVGSTGVASNSKEDKDMTTKFAAPKKKAVTKKAAPKKKAVTKKAMVKKKVTTAKNVGRSNKLADLQGKAETLLKKRKSGYSVPQLMSELGVCRKSVLKLLKVAGADKNAEGNYAL